MAHGFLMHCKAKPLAACCRVMLATTDAPCKATVEPRREANSGGRASRGQQPWRRQARSIRVMRTMTLANLEPPSGS